jgi:Ca2+-binding EF-hand superfamily protein
MMDDNLDEKLQASELRGKMGEKINEQFAKIDVNADGGLDLAELAPVMKAMGARGRGAAE